MIAAMHRGVRVGGLTQSRREPTLVDSVGGPSFSLEIRPLPAPGLWNNVHQGRAARRRVAVRSLRRCRGKWGTVRRAHRRVNARRGRDHGRCRRTPRRGFLRGGVWTPQRRPQLFWGDGGGGGGGGGGGARKRGGAGKGIFFFFFPPQQQKGHHKRPTPKKKEPKTRGAPPAA